MDFREVFNKETGMFRVEQRHFFGWSFVTEPATGDYMNFNSHEEAEHWICENTDHNKQRNRRWRVVDTCSSFN